MADIGPIVSTKPYYVNNRSTVGAGGSFYNIDNDPQLTSTASGVTPRVNKDILYPYSSSNPAPVSSGLVYTG